MQDHPPSSPSSFRQHLPDYFLLGLLGAVLIGILSLLLPLSGAILSAVVIGTSFFPMHTRIRRKFARHPDLAALLTDVLVLVLLIAPTALLLWVMTNEAQSLAPVLKQWQETYTHLKQDNPVEALGGPLRPMREWLRNTLGVQPAQLRQQLVAIADGAVQSVSQLGAAIAKNAFHLLFNLVVMMFTLFFIFRDGETMSAGFQRYLPLKPEIKEHLAHRLHETIVGVIRGWFLTALVQGLTAALGYFIVGVPGVALFGVLTAITGLIPSVGTALVWFPIALFFLLKGMTFKGVFLMIWGTLIVGLLDNFLRPYLMRSKAELPFLALFLAILGGIEAWGTSGIVLGPMLLSITPIIADAYRHRFLTGRVDDRDRKVA